MSPVDINFYCKWGIFRTPLMDNYMDSNKSLGSLIRDERRKHGLTQGQLGKMIGLQAARVSKIENGAPITPEVASFILGRMGSKLQISLVDDHHYDEQESTFLLSAIHAFANDKHLTLQKSYSYLTTFKGIDFLMQHRDIEQTLGYDEICSDLSRVCANNGGLL